MYQHRVGELHLHHSEKPQGKAHRYHSGDPEVSMSEQVLSSLETSPRCCSPPVRASPATTIGLHLATAFLGKVWGSMEHK